jgi:hypothetical protein
MSEIPADIAAAIDAFDTEAQNCGLVGRTTLKHVEAHVALTAAILKHLVAARTQGRDDMERCGGCGAVRIEDCRRGIPSACFRAFHGGKFEADPALTPTTPQD